MIEMLEPDIDQNFVRNILHLSQSLYMCLKSVLKSFKDNKFFPVSVP